MTQVFMKISSWKSSYSSDLVQTLIHELDSSWVLDAILKRELLNQHMLNLKLDFKSFIEA